jgi:hypothetical protein
VIAKGTRSDQPEENQITGFKTARIMRILGMQLANLTGKSAAPYFVLTLYWYTTELQYGPTGLNLMEPDEEGIRVTWMYTHEC